MFCVVVRVHRQKRSHQGVERIVRQDRADGDATVRRVEYRIQRNDGLRLERGTEMSVSLYMYDPKYCECNSDCAGDCDLCSVWQTFEEFDDGEDTEPDDGIV